MTSINFSILVFVTFVTSLAPALFSQSSPAPPEHPPGRYYSISEHKIWIETEGTGAPLILIPGGPGFGHNYFHPWFTALASKMHVIYFDPYGRGKSDHAQNPKEYTFARDVDEIEGIRHALGFDQIAVLGHSYGGMVALAYALKYPTHVSHLILISTLPGAMSWKRSSELWEQELAIQFPEIWEKMQTLRRQGIPDNSKEMDEAVAPLPFEASYFYSPENTIRISPPGEIDLSLSLALTGKEGSIDAGDVGRYDFQEAIHTLKVPMLIMAGRYDRVVVPSETVKYRRWAPLAQFEMFEHSGHFPFIEEPENFNRSLQQFLELPSAR